MIIRRLVVLTLRGNRHFTCFLSKQHKSIQKTCRLFAENELKPIAAQLDKEERFPKEQIKNLGNLGLMSINVSEVNDGSGFDTLALAIAVEEISRGCGGTGAIVSIHNSLYANLLDNYANKWQKENFLRPFTKGVIGCFALSEPDAGSDVSAMSTTADLKNDHYILNGRKSWVTSGYEGKAAIIFATINKELKHKGISAFIVPLDVKGLIRGRKEEKLGIRASSTCDLILDNVEIPKENLLGKEGDGFTIAMKQLDKGRVGIAAQAVGIGQAALELAIKYSNERKQFGEAINQLQAVKMKLGEMAMRLESARLLVWRAAFLCDQLQLHRSTKETSMAKVVASEAATFITHATIQILGGMGYVTQMPAERHYRDARITEIYGGVSDLHRTIIGDAIIKDYFTYYK